MRKLGIIVSVLFTLLFLNACSSKQRVVITQKELPSWYLHPQITSKDTLYAVAEGESKSDAIANALSEMVSTLSVSISSEFNTKSVVKEGDVESVQRTTLSDIRTTVEKIRINNYKVLHSQNFSFERYLVEIQTDKKSLFKSLLHDLERKFQTIERKNKEAKNYYALKELSIYALSLDSLYDLPATLSVMHSLNPEFNDAVYIQKAQNLESKYESLLSKISFSVNTNRDAKGLRSTISKGLSELEYKINSAKDRQHFRVYISSKTSKAKSYGFDLARSAITITVKDFKGSIVGSNKLNITGQSTQGYPIARENIAVKLNTALANEGIANIIGLDI